MTSRGAPSFLFGLCVLVVVSVSLGSPVARAVEQPSELGLDLVPWSKKVGDRRYESPRDFDGTVKFFKDKFKGSKQIRWGREVSVPSAKYVHLENTNDTAKWEGINIYALPDGRVRYYLLERVAGRAAGTPAPASTSGVAPTTSPSAPPAAPR